MGLAYAEGCLVAKSYKEKLLDPRWQRKRLEILSRNDFCCEDCGTDESTLHVHHRYYLKGKNPWEYEDDALVALCENCHAVDHEWRDALNILLACVGPMFMDWHGVIGFTAGILIDQSPDGHMSNVALERIATFANCDRDAFELGRKAHSELGAIRMAKHKASAAKKTADEQA